jgi:hypothetical protein
MTFRKEIMIASLAGLIALGGVAAYAKSPERAGWPHRGLRGWMRMAMGS